MSKKLSVFNDKLDGVTFLNKLKLMVNVHFFSKIR